MVPVGHERIRWGTSPADGQEEASHRCIRSRALTGRSIEGEPRDGAATRGTVSDARSVKLGERDNCADLPRDAEADV